MKAAPEAQRQLLDLQEIDTTIDQLRHKRDSLPEHETVTKIQSFRRQLREHIVAQATIVSDLEGEVKKAEADLIPVKERKTRNQTRIDTGAVPDAKALNALIEEVSHLTRRISELEDEQLDAMERLDAATEKHELYRAKDLETGEKLDTVVARRDQLVAAFDQDIATRTEQRETIAAGLPTDLISEYTRIRDRFGGIGAARLIGPRCSGCQLEATASDLNRYRIAADDEVLHCEECDRILIRD